MTVSSQWLHPRDAPSESYLSDRGTRVIAVSVVFTSLATIFVLARLYTRTKLVKRIEANDWMVIVALTFPYVFMAFLVVECLKGIGMHFADVPPSVYMQQNKLTHIGLLCYNPFYNAALIFAKASILMQYLRIFPSKSMRHTCWIMLTLLATYGTWAILSAFLTCIPVARFWDRSIHGSCLNTTALWYSNAGMHIVTDLAILITPIPPLVKLELPKKQKVALILVFAMGGFGCMTSMIRLGALHNTFTATDPTYANSAPTAWSAVECNVGIICACLPTLRPLVARILPQLFTVKTDRHACDDKLESKTDIAPASTYWGVPGGVGVSTTITTHVNNLEDGVCDDGSNSDRLAASKYGGGYGFGVPAAAGVARTQAMVYVGVEKEKEKKEERKKDKPSAGKNGDVVLKTEVRAGSSSSATAPLVKREGEK